MNAVDLALVLAVDGSASVTFEEFNLIAGGMAAALREPPIIAGLIGGPAKASVCSLLLWSGAGAQEVITGWTLIASRSRCAWLRRYGGQHAAHRAGRADSDW